MKAAMYARFSSDNQREESIDAQIRAIKEYAQHHNIELVAQFTDEALSATTDNRPGFLRMVDEAKVSDWDAIIVHKLDRFSRNRYDSAIYKKQLANYGVRVISVLENLDGSPESVILESVIEGFNEYYSKNLAREVWKGMKENAYQCKHTGGLPPLGYDVTDELEYVMNDYEAEAIRIIFDMYVNGYSRRKIIKRLNESGYRTKKGNLFKVSSIYDILRNEKYSGVYIFGRATPKDHRGKRNNHANAENPIRIEGGMPQIIDTETFEKAKEMMDKNKHRRAKENARIALLTGSIFCGECGRPMITDSRTNYKRGSKYYYYVCSGKKNDRLCDAKSINADKLEADIIYFFKSEIFKRTYIKKIARLMYEYKKEQVGALNTEGFQKELDDINQQLEKAVDAVLQGLNSPALTKKINTLEERKQAIEIELHKNQPSDLPPIELIEHYLEEHMDISTYDREKQRTILEQYIEKIVVNRETISIRLRMTTPFVNNGGDEPPPPVLATNQYVHIIERIAVGY